MYTFEFLVGCEARCCEKFRMKRNMLAKFCETLRNVRNLRDTKKLSVEETIAMFLNIMCY
uniref:DUF8040 domain-containing protein n=1 Tax=Cajanus cajan TaxID=3821 RepID=A0A151SEL7_CAJCA|nr:hypothetical protein KK1_024862 [Cajanus cajan]